MSRRLLCIEGLRYRVGDFSLAVDGLRLETSDYPCVSGPTGSGKTTLLELIAGIRRAASGRIFYRGEDVTRAPPENRFVGFAYQDNLLLPFLNVEANILFGATVGGRKIDAETLARAETLMEKMAIGHLRRRFPRHLSGGERQRVSLARALLLKPPLLLLDEPLSSINPAMREELRLFLKSFCRREQIAVVHVTHDTAEEEALATRSAVLKNGSVIAAVN